MFMEKNCNTCAFREKLVCYKNTLCSKWLNSKASCLWCLHYEVCLKIKPVSSTNVCYNFSKRKEKIKLKEVEEEAFPEENIDTNFSPTKLVESIIENDYDPAVLSLIDDSDILKPRNLVEAIIGHEFLNIPVYAKQLKYFTQFTSSYCPYCSDVQFLNDVEVDTPVEEILDRVVYYEDGFCPECGTSKYEAVKNKDLYFYNQLIGIAGQRSGKTASVVMLCAAITMYYLVKIGNPSQVFNLLDDWVLYGTFVALSYETAKDQLWVPYYNLITKSPWFKNYNSFLDEESKRLGTKLYRIHNESVIYTYKGISVFPSGPDKRILRGKTRFFNTIDEISWFVGGGKGEGKNAIKFDPTEIYAALNNSILTIHSQCKKLLKINPDMPSAYGMYISSPRCITDKGMIMLNQSKGSSNIFGFQDATWDFNPNINKNDLKDYFRDNPINAERDFGANPPYGSSPFINSLSSIVENITNYRNIIKVVKNKNTNGPLGEKLLYSEIAFPRTHNFPAILAIDNGYNNNSFSCIIIHKKDIDGEEVTAISGLLEIIPDNPLSYPKIYEKVISKIIENFNIKLVAFDRWESINLSQMIYDDFNVETVRYSVTMEDFKNFRTDILSNSLILPNIEVDIDRIISIQEDIKNLTRNNPVTHLILQMLMSVDTGKIITKGTDMTDDLLRASVLGYALLTSGEYDDIFDGKGFESTNVNTQNMIVLGTKGNMTNNQFVSFAKY